MMIVASAIPNVGLHGEPDCPAAIGLLLRHTGKRVGPASASPRDRVARAAGSGSHQVLLRGSASGTAHPLERLDDAAPCLGLLHSLHLPDDYHHHDHHAPAPPPVSILFMAVAFAIFYGLASTAHRGRRNGRSVPRRLIQGDLTGNPPIPPPHIGSVYRPARIGAELVSGL